MKNKQPFGLGADESKYDSRTSNYSTQVSASLGAGGVHYEPYEIDHQHNVGICTAISLTQNAQKYTGLKFSPDFQYLIQKKFYDLDWYEGSSIFNALRAGKNQGFLLAEYFPYITEADRNLSYQDYIKKLKAIPDAEIERLLKLVQHKLSGYQFVDVSDPQLIAKAITDSKTGILCRFTVGNEWWTDASGKPSWTASLIDPIRPPKKAVSGHAIIGSYFDFTGSFTTTHANTWGPTWCDQGSCHIVWSDYKMTEAWIPYYDFTPPIKPPFRHHFFQQLDLAFNLVLNGTLDHSTGCKRLPKEIWNCILGNSVPNGLRKGRCQDFVAAKQVIRQIKWT